jgi:hypothetical protein
MLYAFIDSNIWIRIVSQGRPGCEYEHFESLRRLVENGKLLLLLPEVVRLEFKKKWRTFEGDILKGVDDIERAFDTQTKHIWSEIEDIKAGTIAFLKESKRGKLQAAVKHFNEIDDLFDHGNVRKIAFTPEINHLGRKRIMCGGLATVDKNSSHADACIIESLLYGLTHCDIEKDRMLFCSENVRDFALPTNSGHLLHPEVGGGLPPSVFCTDLKKMLTYQADMPYVPPLSDKQLQEALEKKAIAPVPESAFACMECAAPAILFSIYCHKHHKRATKNWNDEQLGEYSVFRAVTQSKFTQKQSALFRAHYRNGNLAVVPFGEAARACGMSIIEAKRVRKSLIEFLTSPEMFRELCELFGVDFLESE